VLQSLYFCKPFRYCIQKYSPVKTEETILTSLSELYKRIASQKKKTGVMAPRKFIAKLRKENGEWPLPHRTVSFWRLNSPHSGVELFRGFTQQDAHEFLNYLLNDIADTLVKEKKLLKRQEDGNASGMREEHPFKMYPRAHLLPNTKNEKNEM